MSYSLSSISPLNVQTWTGFDYPENAEITALLGDGVSTSNALIQQSALTLREGRISGTFTSSTPLGTLRSLYEGKTASTFSDGTDSVSVLVFDLVIDKVMPSIWNYSCRLVTAP